MEEAFTGGLAGQVKHLLAIVQGECARTKVHCCSRNVVVSLPCFLPKEFQQYSTCFEDMTEECNNHEALFTVSS